MSVLFDNFSYRLRITEDGIFRNRWSDNSFQNFTNAERLYYINNIINSILLHDIIYIRIDSLEEFIELMGIDNTNKLISSGILKILDGWFEPGFLVCGNNSNMFMNIQRPTDDVVNRIIYRLKNKFQSSQCSFIYHILKNELLSFEEPSFIDYQAKCVMENDLENENIRALLKITSPNACTISNNEILSVTRLYIFNRNIEWSRYINTDELFLESGAKNILLCKADSNPRETVLGGFDEIWNAKSMPNLSYLYIQNLKSIDDIIELRNDINGIKFRQWIKSTDYNIIEIRKKLMEKIPDNLLSNFLRFCFVEGLGIFCGPWGIAASIVDFLQSQYHNWSPQIYLDSILPKYLKELEKRKR